MAAASAAGDVCNPESTFTRNAMVRDASARPHGARETRAPAAGFAEPPGDGDGGTTDADCWGEGDGLGAPDGTEPVHDDITVAAVIAHATTARIRPPPATRIDAEPTGSPEVVGEVIVRFGVE